ncbi:helicase-like transcription factor isoform X3 [Actinia tenebrosa]|nr:helicase-like transcription factor isoform X3 [Actinia tenebrosa]
MPCDLAFWGRPENQEQVIQIMRQYGFILLKAYNNKPAPSKGDYTNYSIPTSIKISQDQMHNELNKLFDKMEEMDKGDKTAAEVEPAEVIKTKLYPHQKQSLAWMITKENNKDLPPFWEERTKNGKKEYFNTATNYATTKRPSCVKGGILADDMGLGKTLQIISLILTNFHDGKPLATLEDSGTGINKTLKQKVRRPSKHSSKKKSTSKKKNKKAVVVESSEDEEMSDDNDNEAIGIENSNKVMIGKTDPDFKPVAEVNVETESTNIRRSARSRKKPAKYTEVDSDVDEEAETVAPSPKKKSKKKQPSIKHVQNTDHPVEEQQQSDCHIILPPLPSFAKDDNSDAKDTSSLSVGAINTCLTTNNSSKQGSSKTGVGSTAGKRKAVPSGGRRPTLVVFPLSVLSSWENELEMHVHPNLINIYTHYGQNKTKDKKFLEEQDIVLTTYQSLSAEFSRGKSPLKEVKWLRVILDEGHLIRNPRAQMTKAAHALDAERRWIVTGTPIQNSMKDLWSIICFLRMEPFLDRQWWVRSIERPISQGDKAALG